MSLAVWMLTLSCGCRMTVWYFFSFIEVSEDFCLFVLQGTWWLLNMFIWLIPFSQIIVKKHKNLTTFSNLSVGHWKPAVLGVSVNTQSLSEAWTVMLNQPSRSHVKYYFSVQVNYWKHSGVYCLFVHEKVVRPQQNVFRSFVWSSKWRAKFLQILLTDWSL